MDIELNNYPKISIVTPSFNQVQFIEETIISVISQNYPNLEYIIIDGGSTDGSVEIIKKYEKYLTYWVSEPDKGHADALNKGFSRSTGEIMAWLNSDDKYLPWTFQTVAEVFNTFNEVNWITGIPSLFDFKGRMKSLSNTSKNIFDFLLGRYKWIQQESTFWRRRLWEKAGEKINQEYKLMVDTEHWCRFFLYDQLYHIDAVIGGFRFHGSNRAFNMRNQVAQENAKAIKFLKGAIDIKTKDTLKKLRQYHLITKYNAYVKNKIEKTIYKSLLFNLLPYFLFVRIKAIIINYKLKPIDVSFKKDIHYKKIILTIPYQILTIQYH